MITFSAMLENLAESLPRTVEVIISAKDNRMFQIKYMGVMVRRPQTLPTVPCVFVYHNASGPT